MDIPHKQWLCAIILSLGHFMAICLERINTKKPTNQAIGLDLGISHFYTDSDGNQVDYPQYLRQSEKQLKREQRRLSKKQKGSKNRAKARNRLGHRHLKIQRHFVLSNPVFMAFSKVTPYLRFDFASIYSISIKVMKIQNLLIATLSFFLSGSHTVIQAQTIPQLLSLTDQESTTQNDSGDFFEQDSCCIRQRRGCGRRC